MASKPKVDPQVIFDAWVANDRRNDITAAKLGIGEASVRRAIKKLADDDRIEKTKDQEIMQLKRQLRIAEKKVLNDARIQTEILGLSKAPIEPPAWITRQKAKGKNFAGVPTLFASDWHYAEVVRPEEIGGVNEFNIAIAERRAQTFVDQGISLLRDHLYRSEYDGIVLALGGDMLSGDIHEELSQTNEMEMMPALLRLTGVLVQVVERLCNEFGRVFIPCVTGNHGRTSRKPRAKRRNATNFDWLLYNLLAMHFKDDQRVTFQIAEGADAYYRIYNTRYLLTHGDQFRGGDGIIGPLGPIFRGDIKKRSRNVETDYSYDVMILGHHHRYLHTSQSITNGALKGYDEYAFSGNFPFEPAQQALWVTHPHLGITFRMPVILQREKRAEAPWVSVK